MSEIDWKALFEKWGRKNNPPTTEDIYQAFKARMEAEHCDHQ